MSDLAHLTDAEARCAQLVEDLAERTRAFADREQARDAFLVTLAHELRNPIAAIQLQVDALARQVEIGQAEPDRLLPRLRTLQGTLRRFVRRANVLLEVSRFSAGRFVLQPNQIDLTRVVAEAVEEQAAEATHAKAPVLLHLDPHVEGWWDATACAQIALNLLSNAIKYGNARPIDVTLESRPDCAVLTVRDEGIGIAPADHVRIFDRFERAPAARASGFGVGLWLVRQLVQAMSGQITVTSTPGLGSTFVVRLPRHPARNPE